MSWFYVEGIENGGVLNYQIRNHLVEVRDSCDIEVLRKEPHRFRELGKREVAALKKPATSFSIPAPNTVRVLAEEKEKAPEKLKTKADVAAVVEKTPAPVTPPVVSPVTPKVFEPEVEKRAPVAKKIKKVKKTKK